MPRRNNEAFEKLRRASPGSDHPDGGDPGLRARAAVALGCGQLGRARVAPLLIAGLALAALLGCRTDARPLAVYPPAGFNYKSAPRAIRVEHAGLDDFYQLYFTQMTGTPTGDTYGLALANQVLGILRNDPATSSERATCMPATATTRPQAKGVRRPGGQVLNGPAERRYAKAPNRDGRTVTYDKATAQPGFFHRIILAVR